MEPNMKTVKKGKEIRRVSEKEAPQLVKSGWAYCPKGEWKTNVRDAGKVADKFAEVDSKSRQKRIAIQEDSETERRTKRDEKREGKERSEKRQSKYRQKKERAAQS
jgi:hypothetical protein